MFSLVQGVYQYMTQRSQFNILVLGGARSGKSTLTTTLKQTIQQQQNQQNQQISSPQKSTTTTTNPLFPNLKTPTTTTTTNSSEKHEKQHEKANEAKNGEHENEEPFYSPTVGLNVTKLVFEDCDIVLWDLGGQPDLQTIWEDYYSDCHAIIYVIEYDSVDLECVEADIRKIDELSNHEQLSHVPMMIVLNWRGDRRRENEPLDRLLTEKVHVIIERMMRRNELFFIKEMNVRRVGDGGIVSSFQYLVRYLKQNARMVNQNDFI